MADIVLQAIIKKAVDITGNLVIQEGFRLSRVKEDINWIEGEMRYIQSYLEDADFKQYGDTKVGALVSDIRTLGLDVEEIMDTYFPEIVSPKRKGFLSHLRSASSIFSYIYSAGNFSTEIRRIKRRVDDINRRRLTYGIQEKSGGNEEGTWDTRRSFPHLDEPNIVGFKQHIKKLVSRMLDRDSQSGIVSITGMAGLGKTTLAKKVYNSVLQSFECSAWICVSRQPNISEILQEIARQMGMEKEKWEHFVEPNLFEFLHQKRYVIVVDDIWNIESWDALKVGIPNNFENGARIILTSRNRDVGVHVGGPNSLYELQPLDQENSRELFLKLVRGPPQNIEETCDTNEIDNITEQILKRCGGVPLAIVLTAGMLLRRERTEHAWKGVLERMGQEEDQCSKIFALSYKDLPVTLKPCFLYFGLFPEDYEIFAFDLISIWVAEGFIQGSRMQEAEKVGEDYLNHLVSRNLIQVARRSNYDGRVKSLRIHDMLHSLCVRVASEINFFSSDNEVATSNSATRVRRVTTRSLFDCTCINNFQSSKVRAILCFGQYDFRFKGKHFKNFHREFGSLRVLSVECQYFPWDFPSEIDGLSQLNYLQLKQKVRIPDGYYVFAHSSIKYLSTLVNLRNLVTLDVRRCGYIIIPECIWRMQHLKHILLSWECDVRFCPRHVIEGSSLSLETLCELEVPRSPTEVWFPKFMNLRKLGMRFDLGDISNVKVLLDAIYVLHKLETLRLVSFSEQKRYNVVDLNLCRFENLSRLKLKGPLVRLSLHAALPQNLVKLSLEETDLENPLQALRKLPKLKILKLGWMSCRDNSKLQCLGGLGNFPQLEVMELMDYLNVVELILDEEVMPRLKTLRIKNHWKGTLNIPNRIRRVLITN